MHSLVDVVGGIVMGLMILLFWILVNEYIDNFIVSGQNGMHICHCFLLVFLLPLCVGFEFSVNAVDLGHMLQSHLSGPASLSYCSLPIQHLSFQLQASSITQPSMVLLSEL